MMRPIEYRTTPRYGVQEKGPVVDAIERYASSLKGDYGLSSGLNRVASRLGQRPNYWSTDLGVILSTASVELNNAVMDAIQYSRGITNKTRRWAKRHHRVVVEKPKPVKKEKPQYTQTPAYRSPISRGW